ncbi:unnamed protein product, partial [Prunus brigantina]
MPISASMTPPGVGQRTQESERLEPYGEGGSHGTPAPAPASGYGQNFQPPTNGWEQSQPAWANSGPTRPSEMTYSPLHALAITLGQNSPMHSAAQHGGPVHTFAVHAHPGPSSTPAASSQQYGQSNPIISSLQTPLFPLDSHLRYGAAHVTTPHTHLGQTQGANVAPTGPTATAETPQFTLFSGDGHTSSIEHIGRFTAQCGEADSDAHKLRLFVHSLTGAAFSWFINLPPNSVRDWSDMERTFHEHFYQTNREITVAELARMSQATDESPRDYLQRFKTCRN